jgi:hypothetical protein
MGSESRNAYGKGEDDGRKDIMKAKIRKDASAIFAEKVNRMVSGRAVWPKTYSDFYDKLKELSGKTLKVKKIYGKRIYLEYEKPETIDGMKVLGIDMDKELVEIRGKKKLMGVV